MDALAADTEDHANLITSGASAEVTERALVLPPTEKPITPGRVIKAGRQRVGYSIEDIAERTKIAMFTLRAIEEENLAICLPSSILKAFPKIIAMIRLDDDGVVDEYCRRVEAWQRSREGG